MLLTTYPHYYDNGVHTSKDVNVIRSYLFFLFFKYNLAKNITHISNKCLQQT